MTGSTNLRGILLCAEACAFVIAMAAPAAQSNAAARPSEARFGGRITAGQLYQQRFGPDFTFALMPQTTDAQGRFYGWDLGVFRLGDPEDLLQATLPMRGPRPLYLYASYFLPEVNAPGRERLLAFSPEVGHTITMALIEEAARDEIRLGKVLEKVEEISLFGQLKFSVRNLAISGTTPETATFEWVEFNVVASWPTAYDPKDFQFLR